jgi:anti-sigma factor RsiW
MNHQQFEEWLLLEDLPDEEASALKTHLDRCEDCRHLQHSIGTIDALLGASPTAAPMPDFTMRWKGFSIERRQVEERQVAWKLFVFLVFALIAVFTVMNYREAMHIGSPLQLAANSVAWLINSMRWLTNIGSIAAGLTAMISPTTVAVVSTLFFSIVAFWFSIWSVTVWKIVGARKEVQ